MLVLSRKSHESVVVGDSDHWEDLIKITVLEVQGDKVRLGFEANKEMPINRWEVWQRICIERNGYGCASQRELLPGRSSVH